MAAQAFNKLTDSADTHPSSLLRQNACIQTLMAAAARRYTQTKSQNRFNINRQLQSRVHRYLT
eukprot:1437664-Rhodomonas_salina.4